LNDNYNLFQNIPQDIRLLRRFVGWKGEFRKGKWTKIPKNARTGGNAGSTLPSTWSTFEQAIAGMQRYGFDGIGFIFNGDEIIGIDVDDCRNPETSKLTDIAENIIAYLDSYAEISPSGKGVHILCRGKLPEGKRQCFIGQDGVEAHLGFYETGRFFCMTGWLLDDKYSKIRDRQEQITALHQYFLRDDPIQRQPTPITELDIDDREIIRRASSARNSNSFLEMWNGNWKGRYPSQSEADFALLNKLIFWVGRDASRIDRLFRQSGLYRPKWDRVGAQSIENAISTYVGQTYPEMLQERRCKQRDKERRI